MGEKFTEMEQLHYDRNAAVLLNRDPAEEFERHQRSSNDNPVRHAYRAWLEAIESVGQSSALRVLDFCAGQGQHSITIQQIHPQAAVTAIDISAKALEAGTRMAEAVLTRRKPKFIQMDAHSLSFPDESFDVVSEYGSLSSLDFDLAIGEIWRVLRPGGTFVALETFGQNPVIALKRRWNVVMGRRTAWAASHILKQEEIAKLKQRFPEMNCRYFGLTTLASGILKARAASTLPLLEKIDERILNAIPTMSRFAFKVLIVARKPSF